MDFLALGGSLRQHSHTNAILGLTAEYARQSGADARVFTVSDLDAGLFRPGISGPEDAGVHSLLRVVAASSCMLVATPIYGGTPSGAVKNMLDFLHLAKSGDNGALSGKKVAVAAVGGGTLTGRYTFQRGATVTLEIACKDLGAWVDPRHLEFSELLFNSDGDLIDPFACDQLRGMVTRLMDVASRAHALA
jgi:multimeric flavodoxin WrbA